MLFGHKAIEYVSKTGSLRAKERLALWLSLPRLKSLDSDYQLTNDQLRQLSRLAHLKTLSLYSKKITDDGLRHLASYRGLKRVDLLEDARVSDTGIAHLAELKGLTQLSVHSRRISVVGLKHLTRLDRRTRLTLELWRLRDEDLIQLLQLCQLVSLHLHRIRISSKVMTALERLPQLEKLSLSRCHLDPDIVKRIARLRPLNKVALKNTKLPLGALSALPSDTRLRELELSNMVLSGADIFRLSQLDKLKKLQFYKLKFARTKLTRANHEGHVSSGPPKSNLLELDLGGPFSGNQPLSPELFARLAGFSSLRVLNVNLVTLRSTAEDEQLARTFGSFNKLRWLSVNGGIRGKTLAAIGHLSHLRSLILEGSVTSDADLATIEKLHQLRFLWLINKRFKGTGLKHLARLPRLHTLIISHAKITDKVLGHLAHHPTLRTVVLHNTGNTIAGQRQLLSSIALTHRKCYRARPVAS